MDDMARSNCLANMACTWKHWVILNKRERPRSGGGQRQSLITKETFQGENSHVFINSDCILRVCRKMDEQDKEHSGLCTDDAKIGSKW